MTNWREHEAGLRRRGSLTLWLTPEALAGWVAPRRTTRGGQRRYSDLAIETTLTLSMVFALMGLELPVPDHTTLSRRARTWRPPAKGNDRQPIADGALHVLVDSTGLKIYGAGQWLEEKHGAKSRLGWRKLHLALDAGSGEIIAHALTDQGTGDASQVERCSIRSTLRSASSSPMAPMTPSCATVRPKSGMKCCDELMLLRWNLLRLCWRKQIGSAPVFYLARR